MFLAYNEDHLEWITQFKNALFSNKKEFYEEYLESFTDKFKMDQLIKKIEKFYNVKFNFDNKYLDYDLYESEGKYSELSF